MHLGEMIEGDARILVVLHMIIHLVGREEEGLDGVHHRARAEHLVGVGFITRVFRDASDAEQDLQDRHHRQDPKEQKKPAVTEIKKRPEKEPIDQQDAEDLEGHRQPLAARLHRFGGLRRFFAPWLVEKISDELEVGDAENIPQQFADEALGRDGIAADQADVGVGGDQGLQVMFEMKFSVAVLGEK